MKTLLDAAILKSFQVLQSAISNNSLHYNEKRLTETKINQDKHKMSTKMGSFIQQTVHIRTYLIDQTAYAVQYSELRARRQLAEQAISPCRSKVTFIFTKQAQFYVTFY